MPARLSHLITDVAPLDLAGPNDLAFIESNKYADALATTRAGGLPDASALRKSRANHPHRVVHGGALSALLSTYIVNFTLDPFVRPPCSKLSEIAQGSTIHPTARLGSGITVDPGAVIGPRAEIGAGSIIAATAVIGPDVLIGRDCTIGAGCSITHALIGDRVVIHPGCRIGQDGFGYIAGAHSKKFRKRDA